MINSDRPSLGYTSEDGFDIKDGDRPYFIQEAMINMSIYKMSLVHPIRTPMIDDWLKKGGVFFLNKENAERYIKSVEATKHRDKILNQIIDVE